MNFSILSSTVPSLHRLLTSLQTSSLATVIPTTQYELSHGSNQGNTWKSSLKRIGSSINKSRHSDELGNGNQSSNNAEGKTRILDFRADLVSKNEAYIQQDPIHLAESGSRTSDGSQDMIIRQTAV
jgi:hypothetical protein